METTTQQATEARAEFDRVIAASGILDDDTLGATGIESLYDVFWAGVVYGIKTQQKPVTKQPEFFKEQPKNESYGSKPKYWPKRKPGEKVEIKNPDEQASDKQYQYLKSLVAGDEAKARGIMTREEYDKLVSDIGVLTKGQASDLIDRLVKAGIKPKRSKS